MDFQDLLAQASHNAQASTRHVRDSDREAQLRKLQERRRFESELQKEREERKRKAPPKVEKRFVIPKKKPATEEAVDPKGVEAFIRKQRQMEAEKEAEKRKERDRLISLRLQANQGRANKKIASQFGKSAIELQQKYAHNSNVELELLKRQQREDEELERKGKQIRESINRAVESRAAKIAKTPQTTSGAAKGTTRVGNVKAGGFAALSAKHESLTTKQKAGDEFRTASSSRGATKTSAAPKRPPTAAPALTYNDLLEAAKKNREGTAKSDRPNDASNGRPTATPKIAERPEVAKRTVEPTRRPPPPPAAPSVAARTTQQPAKATPKTTADGKNPYAEADRRTFGPPPTQKPAAASSSSRKIRPLPATPRPPSPAVGSSHSNPAMFGGAQKKEPRYLPGDLRYKPPADAPAPTNGTSKPKVITFADRFRKMAAPSAQSSSSSINSQSAAAEPPAARPAVSPPSAAPPKWKAAAAKKLGFPGAFRGRPIDSSAFDSTVRVQRGDERSAGRSADRDRRAAAETFGAQAARPKAPKRPADVDRNRRPLSHPGMFNKNRAHLPSTSFVSGGLYSDEEEEEDDRYDDYEDEHDSEMDDFIDDTELDDWQTADFEESLKMVNRNYNKKKWEMRERMIDERRMDARFRDVEAEEKRSAREAMIEDLREAKRGSKGIA